MKKTKVTAALAVALGFSGTVGAQSNESEHPEFLVGARGYEWVAASRMLNDDGSPNVEFASQTFLDGLEYQKEWPCQAMIISSPFPPESRGHFAASLLLSDVAVRATVDDIVPGFSPGGEPALLLSLSDVLPLRDQTPLPDYTFMEVQRVVVEGRVFCEISNSGGSLPKRIPLPQVGDDVVVIGRWTSDSVVRMGLYRRTGALGVVGDDGESLEWHFSAYMDGPKTLTDMRQQIDDAAASGLLDATRGIAQDDHYSLARRNLADRVVELQQSGCRIDSVEQHEGDLTFLHTCPDAQE
ncbi:MAG: hypothetical protein OXG74_08620 [Acidobacteria bacterium]|nr:hypothetical protein [Acidobacteriota bacterium]